MEAKAPSAVLSVVGAPLCLRLPCGPRKGPGAVPGITVVPTFPLQTKEAFLGSGGQPMPDARLSQAGDGVTPDQVWRG